MIWKNSGVAKQIKDLQPKALETHCHCYSLNLSVKNVTSRCRFLENAIGTVGEICILIKKFSKRENILAELQNNICIDDNIP